MGKIEDLILKSRELFIKEQVLNIDKATRTLFRYRLNKKREDKLELKRFFHLIKGTSATLGLDTLSKIGEEYENYLDFIENSEHIPHQVFSKILKGLADIYIEIENLSQEYVFDKENKGIQEIEKNKFKDKVNKGNILIVDDDIVILDLLEKVFHQEDYDVTTSSNPDAVIDILKEKQIDLIILDVMMPEKDGFEILKQIREEKFSTPIIFLTAKNITKDKVKALKAGVDDYITKPFQMEELIARVESILKKINVYRKRIRRDNLTGVYNKKYFLERVEQLNNNLSDKNNIFSIAFIDLDYFKIINDKYGHLAGDYILKMFVDELKTCLRGSDEIYRFGGDEFLILFSTSGDKAYEALERARYKIEKRKFYYKDKTKNITMSFSAGISSVLEDDNNVENILERADKALYMSKEYGRGKTIYFEKEVNKKKKILIIDDSNIIVHMIKTMLLSLNYDVIHANDGEEGVRLVKEVKPDLVILDLILPKLDGYEVCKQIKDDLETNHAKIIILSANCNEKDVLKCFKVGADDYMIKPFSLLELEDRIKRLLKK